MKEFRINLLNRPGELDRLVNLLANHNINVKAIAAVVSGPQPVLGLVASDETQVQSALEHGGFPFEIHELITISLPDKPGELAKLTRRLADAMVNVESIYLMAKAGMEVQFGVTVDNPHKAKHALASD